MSSRHTLTLKLVVEVPERVYLLLPQIDQLQITLAATRNLHQTQDVSEGLIFHHEYTIKSCRTMLQAWCAASILHDPP